MSRTYRKTSGDLTALNRWVYDDHIFGWVWDDEDGIYRRQWTEVKIDPKSKEGRKRLAMFHADGYRYRNGGVGPMWFIREYVQVPYRAGAKNELHKFYRDPDYEVMIESMPSREYWD
jgi:hypothetical protein